MPRRLPARERCALRANGESALRSARAPFALALRRPARLRRFVERPDLCFLLQAVVDVVVRVVLHQAFDDVLAGPRDQLRADRAAAIEFEWMRARQLDWTPDPPAATGRGIERVLPIAI